MVLVWVDRICLIKLQLNSKFQSLEKNRSTMAAHYSCNYYPDDHGKYPLIPIDFESASFQYSSNKFNDHQQFSYFEPVSSYSTIAYSASNFSVPTYVVAYDHPVSSCHVQTQFIVSYSVSDFNFPGFEELNPTPYSGGYDPDQTYGKPLPPSDEICYPRSNSDSNPSSLIGGVSNGTILAPYGKEVVEEKVPTEEANLQEENRELPATDAEQPNSPVKSQEDSSEMNQGEEIKGKYKSYGRNYQIPPGYGLEAMDICESLFGYWPPCLSRNVNVDRIGGDDGQESAENYWNGTADYLFGSPNPYSESTESYGNGNFGYERESYYEEQQPIYQEVESADYVEESWLG